MTEHKKICLKINVKQTVKIKFKNYKQLAMPFKVYANFECIVKKVESSDKNSDRGDNDSYTKKYQDDIPCSYAYKVACVDDRFSKPIFLYRRKNAVSKFIKAILEEYDYCKNSDKRKHFNKNLVMSAEDKGRFQLSSKC